MQKGRAVPGSWWLDDELKPRLRPVTRDDVVYERAFDRFEYMLTLMCFHDRNRGPGGRYYWRRWNNKGERVIEAVGNEIDAMGADWPPLRAGLFDESLDRLKEVKAAADDAIYRGFLMYT